MVLSMQKWAGKVAIVTGASAGIGVALVDALVEHGLIVVGVARRSVLIEKRAKELFDKKGRLYSYTADITNEQEVLKLFQWTSQNLGPVHVLVNNAGVAVTSTLTEGETFAWKKVFDLNVLALCVATREAVKIMKEKKINGHIVHINSAVSHSLPNVPGMNVYSSSKCAVTALTETLRQELNYLELKIKVTSLSPGFTESELTTSGANLTPETLEQMKEWSILKGEDIADALIYVLSTPEHVQIHELLVKPAGEKF